MPRAFEKRQASDYGDFTVLTKPEVERIRDETTVFVEECSRLVEHLGSGPEQVQ